MLLSCGTYSTERVAQDSTDDQSKERLLQPHSNTLSIALPSIIPNNLHGV